MASVIVKALISIIAVIVVWSGFDLIKAVLTKDAPRKPQNASDNTDYDFSNLQMAVWLIEHPDKENQSSTYKSSFPLEKSLFSYKEVKNKLSHNDLTEENLLKFIAPAALYMSKRYDCSDFRAIWLCKLRYALINSPKYNFLLTESVDSEIKKALTGFKYFITSQGKDSMCYYSENHQMVFAVSEYLAAASYPDEIFSIDGKTGREHLKIANDRLSIWFDQRGKFGFSEFLSSNYLAVDIGAISTLLSYCEDESIQRKATAALNMLFFDYALHMYDYGFSGPAGRNYARNNANFMASIASNTIVSKVWNTGSANVNNWYSGFPYLFISLYDSGKYTVPEAIISLGADNNKGEIKTSSGLSLEEMKEKNMIGTDEYSLMFQLGMGALSNKEVISNTMNLISRYKLSHNNFLSAFKYFNIRPLVYSGIVKRVAARLNPFTNGMAIGRNNTYSFSTKDYKLSTAQQYSPNGYGAQQTLFMANLPCGINVFTTNPMKKKEFFGYGVAPLVCQNENCLLSIFNIPKKDIFLALGPTENYTSTYFPSEKFERTILDGRYVFAKVKNSYIGIIGCKDFKYEQYKNLEEFEERIFDRYNFTEGLVGPYVDSYRLKDYKKGFNLKQEGNSQYVIYELGSADNESFEDFMNRIKENLITFDGSLLTYRTLNSTGTVSACYSLDLQNGFRVNDKPINTEYSRYDCRFGYAERKSDSVCINHNGTGFTLIFNDMYYL